MEKANLTKRCCAGAKVAAICTAIFAALPSDAVPAESSHMRWRLPCKPKRIEVAEAMNAAVSPIYASPAARTAFRTLAATYVDADKFEKYKAEFLKRGEVHTNVVDVMIAFDKSAEQWVKRNWGGTVESFARDCLATMNRVLVNSKLDGYFTFNLVAAPVVDIDVVKEYAAVETFTYDSGYVEKVEYTDYDTAIEDAAGVSAAGKKSAVWKALRAERDLACADLVSILVDSETSGTVGLAYSLDDLSIKYPSYMCDVAYSMVCIGMTQENLTQLHELAHIMGAGHSDEMDISFWTESFLGPQLFSYSSSAYFDASLPGEPSDWRYTVMGYNYPGPSWVDEFGYEIYADVEESFSSPLLFTNGVAKGDARHDNARTLRETYAMVANYRVRMAYPRLLSPAPGDVVVVDASSPEIAMRIEPLAGLKASVKGLPPGMQFDAQALTISGTPTKPGVYTVTVSLANQTISNPVVSTFDIVVPNLWCEALPGLKPAADAYGVVVCGVAFDPGLVDCTPSSGWSVKVAGLPSGLKYDAKTGKIAGVPTKAGTYTVTFTATRGKEKQTATITLNVDAMPAWAAGAFAGSVKYRVESGELAAEFGSVALTVAANGKINGKIALFGTNWTFSATSFSRVENADGSSMSEVGSPEPGGMAFVVEAVAKAGKATMPVSLEVREVRADASSGVVAMRNLVNGVATGAIGEGCEATLRRNVWKDKATAAAAKAALAEWEGLYTLSLDGGGYLSLSVGKDGSVKASGKLSDGTKVSASSPLAYDESNGWMTYFYNAPSAYKGGCLAVAVAFDGPRGALTTVPPTYGAQWTSRNPQATGRYGEGFARVLNFSGAYYGKKPNVSSWSSAAFSAESPDSYTLSGEAPKVSVAQATGIFKGSCSFLPVGGGKAKKANFEGIVVLGAESLRGCYLWDAASSYTDPKTGKAKTYKYKQSFPVTLRR